MDHIILTGSGDHDQAYVIDVNNIDKQERWTVRRRFRDFVELDKLVSPLLALS